MPYVTTTVHALFNRAFRNTAGSWPATVYLGLFKVSPILDGTGGTEVTTNDFTVYARQVATFSSPSSRTISNSVACLYVASATLGPGGAHTITHAGIFDAATAGNLMAYGALTSPLSVGAGSLVNIPIGQLIITDPGT
jgi:hypothetical protein